jgi:hypothetical protein
MTSTATLNYPPPTTAPVRTPAGRTGAMIGGGVLATVGAVIALTGGAVLAIGGSDGTFTSDHENVSSTTHALVSEVASIDGSRELSDALGRPHVRVNSDSGQPVFVGVARKADVDSYLAGVEIDRVTDIDDDAFGIGSGDGFALDKTHMSGAAHPKPPATQSFWVAKSTGSTANLDWKVRDGNYRLVIMNADGSRGVQTQSQFELEVPHLGTIAIVALILGLVVIGGGAALMVAGGRTRKSEGAPNQYAIG